MIDYRLQIEYEKIAGPVQFSMVHIDPAKYQEVEEMMREVIAGKRAPITDADLGVSIPLEADS